MGVKAKPPRVKVRRKPAIAAKKRKRSDSALPGLQKRLASALEQHKAITAILDAIADSPTDVQPVLATVAEQAARLCDAAFAQVLLVEGNVLRPTVAYWADGGPRGRDDDSRAKITWPISRSIVSGRAVIDRKTIHHADLVPFLDTDYPDTRAKQQELGTRAVLGVPLLREAGASGAIFIFRREPRPFSAEQIALVETFARQAAIAIENVRLFNETKEALERQTATSEILRVISQSPNDVQPVFDTIAKAAMKLCRASAITVTTFDGQLLHLVAFATATPEGADAVRQAYPRPVGRDTASTRAVLTCSIAAIPDVLEDVEFASKASAVGGGFRSVLAVPLLRDSRPIGAIAVGRLEPGSFPEKQVGLLQTFADQAVIAIENVRLFTELRERTAQLSRSVDELTALGQVSQALSSTLDLEAVLTTIVRRATELSGADGGSVYEYDEAAQEFRLRAVQNFEEELVEAARAMPARRGEGALGLVAARGQPIQFADIAEPGAYQSRVREMLLRTGYRALLAVPLLRDDLLVGALLIGRKSPGDFSPDVIALLTTFANQSALAVQNARLFREIEEKSRQLELASQHKSQFLANMSHELRTPLNAIIGFSEVLSERMFGEINEKQAEYLGDILQSGQHLLSLINDILDLSKIEAGRMELELSDFDLPSTIENVLTLVRERAQRRGIALTRSVDEGLGTIYADERKVKQVLLNLLSNALKFTPTNGQISVRAEAQDGTVEVSVADTGVGIAPEDQEKVFEEFRQVGTSSKKVEGTGLGLAISRKFIELHGGTIKVTSTVGSGSTFTFTLPVD